MSSTKIYSFKLLKNQIGHISFNKYYYDKHKATDFTEIKIFLKSYYATIDNNKSTWVGIPLSLNIKKDAYKYQVKDLNYLGYRDPISPIKYTTSKRRLRDCEKI